MRIGRRTYDVDWGHLVLVTALAGACVAYLFDARSTSLNIQNLLLLQPMVLVVVVLYLAILPQCFLARDKVPDSAGEAASESLKIEGVARVMAVMVALGAFAFTLDIVGFDVATFLFIVVTMAICGERRPLGLVLFPVGMTLFIIYSLRALVSFPMPTAIL
jgi:Tripartite tricarboxylate transporter TctB family